MNSPTAFPLSDAACAAPETDAGVRSVSVLATHFLASARAIVKLGAEHGTVGLRGAHVLPSTSEQHGAPGLPESELPGEAGVGSMFGEFADEQLLVALDLISTHRRHLDTYTAWAAGEIARRSRVEHGHSGLAQRSGFANAAALIRARTQTTFGEAAKLVALGTILVHTALAERSNAATAPVEESAASGPGQLIDSGAGLPWEASIGVALAAGRLSSDSGDAIRRGLGHADEGVTGDMLAVASAQLVEEAPGMSADHLLRRSRELRDEIDRDGVALRERQQQDARRARKWIRRDGMYQIEAVLDPENGQIVFAALDGVLGPRRGGPRFVSTEDRARAKEIVDDPRTDDQLCADALVDMIRIAAEVSPATMLGGARPAVRVIVTQHDLTQHDLAQRDLARRDLGGSSPGGRIEVGVPERESPGHGYIGHGYIEGVLDPVSLETIDRHLCDTGTIGVLFDDEGQCVNVGREKRLFTGRQRVGLALRDGGCMMGDCDQPPSWCEAHHIDEWGRGDGQTNIEDGILLCRFHHLNLHNNGWRIFRSGASYYLTPPRFVDPDEVPIPLPSKSRAYREAMSRNSRSAREEQGVMPAR